MMELKARLSARREVQERPQPAPRGGRPPTTEASVVQAHQAFPAMSTQFFCIFLANTSEVCYRSVNVFSVSTVHSPQFTAC
jgi:hypothetical protein